LSHVVARQYDMRPLHETQQISKTTDYQ